MKTVATRRWGNVRLAEEMDSSKGEKSEDAIAKASEKAADKVTKEPCSEGDEQKIADEAAKKAEGISKSSSVVHVGSVPKMSPKQAAQALHNIAQKLEASSNPDPDLVAFDLQRVLASIGFQSAVSGVKVG
jgi:hypothetical protein